MNLPIFSAIRRFAAAVVIFGSPVQAQDLRPAHQYDFSNSFADALGGPAIQDGGGKLLASRYRFRAGQGPSLRNALASLDEYTIVMVVNLDITTRYRALVNFDNLKHDRSVFVFDGSIHFYPIATDLNSRTLDLEENRWHRIVMTRERSVALVSCYVDGRLRFSAFDLTGEYIANATADGALHFFRDNSSEESGGELDQICIYHHALSAEEVGAMPALGDLNAVQMPSVPGRSVRTLTGSPPVANAQTVEVDGETVITLTGADADPATALSYRIVSPPAHGTLSGIGPKFVFLPEAGYRGSDSFQFTVHDGGFESAQATVNLSILPVGAHATPKVSPPKFADPNPSEANGFGDSVVTLATGNVVITSPQADVGGVKDCGAVYLFNGNTGALISTLTGSTVNDLVGNGGVTALANGNFVISSQNWDRGNAVDAGAVTWGNGVAGVSGPVGSANSLVGSASYDLIGFNGVTALANGNYVVCSAAWDNGAATDAGAVTWGNGATGTFGPVSVENSVTGSAPNHLVGSGGALALPNGHYVIASPAWDNASAVNVGAITWANGNTGFIGTVGPQNSMIGGSPRDQVGSGGIVREKDGSYLVRSPAVNRGRGVSSRYGGDTPAIGVVRAE